MMFWGILANNFLNQCSTNISYLNHNNWIGITMLVVLTFMMVGAVAYGFSGIFPASMREKIKGAVKYEYVQGIFSLVLTAVIFSALLTACSAVGSITSSATKLGSPAFSVAPTCSTSYTDPFQFSNCYIGNLLFSKGTTLITDMISEGIFLFVSGNTLFFIVNSAAQNLPTFGTLGSGLVGGTNPVSRLLNSLNFGFNLVPTISTSEGPAEIFYDYSSILTFVFETLIVATFGFLFLLFMSLSFIETLSLTLVLPVAIAMRCISFAGPKLREASNAFIAIAIAFYFILPVTIAMNYYIVNWTYCANGASCNPYAGSYLGAYTIDTLPLINLFTNPEYAVIGSSSGGTNFNLPTNFYGAILQTNGGVLNTFKNTLVTAAALPNVMNTYSTETAQYVFQGIFLLALDIAITIGFAVGLFKGLETVGQIIGAGPFWSG